LGPFGIKPTTFKGTSFNQISWGSPNQGGMFAMEKSSFGHTASLRALSNYVQDWPIIGQFSPAHPITLSTVEKKLLSFLLMQPRLYGVIRLPSRLIQQKQKGSIGLIQILHF